MFDLNKMGAEAKAASRVLMTAGTELKNRALESIACALDAERNDWLLANELDIKAARANGMRESLIDRLLLTDQRIDGIIKGVREVKELIDPVGITLETNTRPNGLVIEKRTVPIGVIGIIYEARPNVTVDAAVLTLKSGNAVILRGGKEAINSNLAVIKIMQKALVSVGLPAESVQVISDTSRESSQALMNLTEYVDVLIPRGGRGLIRSVVAEAKVPVIKTGEGVCHVYIDKDADLKMGALVLNNAKTSRPSVCNAAECVIIHREVLEDFLKEAVPMLKEHNVRFVCDESSIKYVDGTPATEEDWDTEYGDYVLAVKTVDSLDEAISFIEKHGTSHSEAIITENAETAAQFLNQTDAAAVYWNASTRFTDGGEFGLGAEIGISTQKMHARGPMGLREITSYKYVVTGKGQIR